MGNTVSTKKEIMLLISRLQNISPEAFNLLCPEEYAKKVRANLLRNGHLKQNEISYYKRQNKRQKKVFTVYGYSLTSSGNAYLRELLDDDTFELETVRTSNDQMIRILKMSDSLSMAKTAGAHEYYDDIMNQIKLVEKECKIFNSNVDEDKEWDISDITKNPIGIEDMSSKIGEGIFCSANEIKKGITIGPDDVGQYRFSSLTGVLLTKNKPYCMYHGLSGYLPQSGQGEKKVSTSLIYYFAHKFQLHFSDVADYEIKDSIVLCKNKASYFKLVTNKYQSHIATGETFDRTYIVPINRQGKEILRRFIVCPEYMQLVTKGMIAKFQFTPNHDSEEMLLPLKSYDNTYIYLAFEMEVNSLRRALSLFVKKGMGEDKSLVILCYPWQKPYYEEVLSQLRKEYDTSNIVCQEVSETVVDKLANYEKAEELASQKRERNEKKQNENLFRRNSLSTNPLVAEVFGNLWAKKK